MSQFFLELDSTYRNRNEYPYAADFVAPISLTANAGAVTAVDPVSNAAPLLIFTPFTQLTGVIETYTTPPSSSGVVLQIPVGQAASKVFNYYSGLTIRFFDGTNFLYQRIDTWQYLQTFGGNDYFEITYPGDILSVPPPAPGVVSFTLTDPSSVSDPNQLVFFAPLSPLVKNYYAGYFIFNQTRNEWVTITDYGALDHLLVATPQPTDNYTPGTWLLTDTYVIRQAIPVQYGNVLVGITPTTMTIVNTLSSYIGNFIRLVSTNEMRRITAFNPLTDVATVSPGFSSVPSGAYEILQFSYDNLQKVVFNFSEVSTSNAVCYNCSLLNIVVPNKQLKYAFGGYPIFYPYLYVELTAVSAAEGKAFNMIASNNPNAFRVLFRVLVNDSNNETISPVVRLDGNGMVQKMKLRALDSFHFAVYKPNGELLISDMADTYSPLRPNPFVQISALFSFERVN